MSDISFSHEFSQHWRLAPEKIKNAIVQELGDIVKLLDKETELEDFSFQCANLDAYIDDTYAQFIEEENDSPQVAYNQDYNNTESEEQSDSDEANPKQTNQGATTTLTIDTLSNEEQSDSQIIAISDNTNETEEDRAKEVESEEDPNNQSTLTKSDLSENHAYVIQELETHIDDYLSEHMTSLSEDLKKWLHDEVKQRINSL